MAFFVYDFTTSTPRAIVNKIRELLEASNLTNCPKMNFNLKFSIF